MITYIALLRGINVGGKNLLPMRALRDILASLGCADVQTYIQSGNAVFSSDSDADTLMSEIRSAIEIQFGFTPMLLLLTREEFSAIAISNPFAAAEPNPKFLHVWFLAAPPANADLDAINDKQAKSETYALMGNAFYLHAPEGIGRSKLASHVEKYLGVAATARNWRTVIRLLDMASTASPPD